MSFCDVPTKKEKGEAGENTTVNANEETGQVSKHRPVATSHSFAERSYEPDSSCVESPLKLTAQTVFTCSPMHTDSLLMLECWLSQRRTV